MAKTETNIVGSKRYKALVSGRDILKALPLDNAVEVIKSEANAKFDETVDIAVSLGVDVRHSDQNVRGATKMPNGLGKEVRVAVFAAEAKAAEAKKAGADIVGADDLVEAIQKGEINFDRCIATPDMMPLLGKVAKVLGPKGLMPNPKLGTVTDNVAEAVKEAKAGTVEFRAEKGGIVHAGIGKASFEKKALLENINSFIEALRQAKPSGVKGIYIKKVSLSSTMGSSVLVDLESLAA